MINSSECAGTSPNGARLQDWRKQSARAAHSCRERPSFSFRFGPDGNLGRKTGKQKNRITSCLATVRGRNRMSLLARPSRKATIHDHRLTCNIGRRVATEPQDSFGGLLGPANAPQRN
jgi:hypothetical protein